MVHSLAVMTAENSAVLLAEQSEQWSAVQKAAWMVSSMVALRAARKGAE
jgi:hypothetical protein